MPPIQESDGAGFVSVSVIVSRRKQFLAWPVVQLVAMLCLLAFLGACAPVRPWERGTLAKPHMSLDPDPLESRFMQHVYDSKTASSGGYGAGGGGCGCN
ncbi:MAG: DUF4266 domain-containing protein [Bdellovibrionales bacterium]|nr:DUF4266 domain-containing protein [Bdellovibrionales bacterium]